MISICDRVERRRGVDCQKIGSGLLPRRVALLFQALPQWAMSRDSLRLSGLVTRHRGQDVFVRALPPSAVFHTSPMIPLPVPEQRCMDGWPTGVDMAVCSLDVV
jgi:hypothetical protein